MNAERDKFLTEAMGECWHEWELGADEWGSCEWECVKCNKAPIFRDKEQDNDFSTWDGFGKLFEWCKTQEWWSYMINISHSKYMDDSISVVYVNPDKFADAIYAYLKVVEGR